MRVIATWSLSIRLPTKIKSSELVTMRAQSTVTKSQEEFYKMQLNDLTETLFSRVYMHASFQLKIFFIIYNVIEIWLKITIGNSLNLKTFCYCRLHVNGVSWVSFQSSCFNYQQKHCISSPLHDFVKFASSYATNNVTIFKQPKR